MFLWASLVSHHKESACNAGDTGDVGSIPGLGRSSGGGNGNPLQYFLPEQSHGTEEPGGLHEITKSWTKLSD